MVLFSLFLFINTSSVVTVEILPVEYAFEAHIRIYIMRYQSTPPVYSGHKATGDSYKAHNA